MRSLGRSQVFLSVVAVAPTSLHLAPPAFLPPPASLITWDPG